MKAFLINLDRDVDRLAAADAQLRRLGIVYERVKAVDGKDLSRAEIRRNVARTRALWANGSMYTPGQIGCWLSHTGIYRRMLAERIPAALVLEDDVTLSEDAPRVIAFATIVILGVSFSLVPAALWPSVPKIIDEKILGSAYCLIFWVQNIGLCFVPLLIGSVLSSSNASNPDVIAAKAAGAEFIPYNYTIPLLIFAGFGVAALLIAIYLKALDKKRSLGLELPNIQK